MSGEPITLREFQDTELLREYAALLREHEIPYQVEDTKPRFDVTFANDRSRLIYRIKVQPGDFEKAREISAAADRKTMEELPADYYLFNFTNDELKEVLVKADEWNPFDVLLAEKLLQERGITINAEQLRRSRNERIDLLDQPEDEDTLIVVCGYILTFIGIVPGLIIALILLNGKKTTHDGRRVLRYSARTRRHAGNMILIFCIWLSLWFVFVYTGGIF